MGALSPCYAWMKATWRAALSVIVNAASHLVKASSHITRLADNRHSCFLLVFCGGNESNESMSKKLVQRYLFASDFDQTLTFNDSGYVLSELVGIPTDEFERKAKGMAKLNLVQQGAELAYLLLHDPEFRSRVRKEHL
jgi:hypothetical protein